MESVAIGWANNSIHCRLFWGRSPIDLGPNQSRVDDRRVNLTRADDSHRSATSRQVTSHGGGN
ncbi:hypothetical protein [Limnothrix sp. PR1529]|uniref:hypothetical protein n=1 Tax=Limnothrix sp. PR1529 TaxID=1704291 RepID=UPI00117A16FB|nr:hypothetical protein [Limnothrix sp. PR1529]